MFVKSCQCFEVTWQLVGPKIHDLVGVKSYSHREIVDLN